MRLLTALLLVAGAFFFSKSSAFLFAALVCGTGVLASLQASGLTPETRLQRLREKQVSRVAGLFSADSMPSISVEGDSKSAVERLLTVENVSKACLAVSLCCIAFLIGS